MSEVPELPRDLVIIVTRDPADCEQSVSRHVQDRNKVVDLHVVLPPVAHPPVLSGIFLDIREFLAVRPQIFETTEILTLVPSPSLAEPSIKQLGIQESPVLL